MHGAVSVCEHVRQLGLMAAMRTRYRMNEADAIALKFLEFLEGKAPIEAVGKALISNDRTRRHLREMAPHVLLPAACQSCAWFEKEYIARRRRKGGP